MTEEWECLSCGAKVPAPNPRRPFEFHPPCADSGMGVLVPVQRPAPTSPASRSLPVPIRHEPVEEGP